MVDLPSTEAFPRFPEFPAEIRLMIWRECLPRRVYELDEDEFYERGEWALPLICGNRMTTQMNIRPPAISRVCRESRNVAMESRIPLPHDEMIEEAYWESETMVFGRLDPSRDTVHLNWLYWDVIYECEGNPVEYLAWHAIHSAQGGSLMINDIRGYDLKLLESIPNLLVVMRKIIIHASAEYGLRSGLFGLAGDAPVQLVDISDQKRLDEFFALAEETQGKGHVTAAQDLQRKSCEEFEETFTAEIDRSLKRKLRTPEQRLPRMRGAIMFRLCTDMCNNSEEAEEGFRPRAGPTRISRPNPIRGRGRGRGRGGRGSALQAAGEEHLSRQPKAPIRMRGRLRNKVIA
ncbi:hypothetical protein N7466_006345 [Penicillium verhagenii]|uniref:uncharacterized protein n=1 Tax=Penicillium verhagenii TaxID=1562060 RepID=UPI002544EC52|nr:uncharacterized protein N7466_006345 [Penicillium verhagenii]KAJ5930852.1 hypothetical protein N7466_006345 [Penicillium verhagenii]